MVAASTCIFAVDALLRSRTRFSAINQLRKIISLLPIISFLCVFMDALSAPDKTVNFNLYFPPSYIVRPSDPYSNSKFIAFELLRLYEQRTSLNKLVLYAKMQLSICDCYFQTNKSINNFESVFVTHFSTSVSK